VDHDSASLVSTAPAIPLARVALLAMLLGALLAAVATGLALRIIRVQVNNVDWVSHTLEVRQKLAVFRATVRGAGSGIRVYLMTRTESYLDGYREAAAALPVQLNELEQLTSDNPVQKVHLAELRPLVEARLRRLDAYVHGQEATVSWLDETKRNLDAIRQVADRIDAEEARLLDLRKGATHRNQTLAEVVLSLGLLLSITLTAVGWWLQKVEQRKEADWVQLLHVGSLVANNASRFEEALLACLEQVCEITGWPGGHVHRVTGEQLVSMGIWRLPPRRELHGLRGKLEAFRAPVDIGIAGQLVSLKRPGWIRLGRSRPADEENPIRDAIAEAGFRGFVAVPVIAQGQVPALIEFFLDEWTEPAAALLEAVANIGGQLGRVYERARVLELLEKHADEIQALSITDELTGLLNRRGFVALAEQQIRVSARKRERCCLLFMDMDGLKAINDQLGHGEGDLALCRLAETLQKTFREGDLLARLGGDEFVALAVDTSDAAAIIGRIQQNLVGVTVGDGLQLPVAVSSGSTWIEPASKRTIDEALAVADAEMYARKRTRRAARAAVPVTPKETV
jgi:diguanylate cyclase (GGDEF)-like protein